MESKKGLERISGLEKVAAHPFQPRSLVLALVPAPSLATCTGTADWLDPSPSLSVPPHSEKVPSAGHTQPYRSHLLLLLLPLSCTLHCLLLHPVCIDKPRLLLLLSKPLPFPPLLCLRLLWPDLNAPTPTPIHSFQLFSPPSPNFLPHSNGLSPSLPPTVHHLPPPTRPAFDSIRSYSPFYDHLFKVHHWSACQPALSGTARTRNRAALTDWRSASDRARIQREQRANLSVSPQRP